MELQFGGKKNLLLNWGTKKTGKREAGGCGESLIGSCDLACMPSIWRAGHTQMVRKLTVRGKAAPVYTAD